MELPACFRKDPDWGRPDDAHVEPDLIRTTKLAIVARQGKRSTNLVFHRLIESAILVGGGAGMEGPENRRAKMVALVQQWKASGKGAREFARENGVTPWVLYYWRQRAARNGGPARGTRRSRAVKLVPVRVISGSADGGELEVILATGARVRVPEHVSVERLHRVLQVVKRC
jgi:transposase-like protein